MLVAQRPIDVHRIFTVDSASLRSADIICIHLIDAASTGSAVALQVRDLDLQTSHQHHDAC
jgi:hypothetical protein